MDIKKLLEIAVESNASDLHLVCGSPPTLRIDGELIPMEMDILTGEITKEMIYSLLNELQPFDGCGLPVYPFTGLPVSSDEVLTG